MEKTCIEIDSIHTALEMAKRRTLTVIDVNMSPEKIVETCIYYTKYHIDKISKTINVDIDNEDDLK